MDYIKTELEGTKKIIRTDQSGILMINIQQK